MPSLDQRILIPAPPELIWQFLGEIEKHRLWQQGCERVLPLSVALHEPGARWRYIQGNGPDYVMEITAYLPRAGMEYAIVDGLPIQGARGRFRLQEVNEGTAVYWSLEFESKGFLSRAGRQKRTLEAQMAVSLRQLWQLVRELPDHARAQANRASVQEAPDADARAKYIPRHSSKFPPNDLLAAAAATPLTLDDTQQIATLNAAEVAETQPPASEEDTATMPALTSSEIAAAYAEDTPAVAVPYLSADLFDTESLPALANREDERSIFDIFGIQRTVVPPTYEGFGALTARAETAGVTPIHSGNELSEHADRPREGARTRRRRRHFRNLKQSN